MNLPEAFVAKYKQLLGEDAEAFLASFDASPVAAFRVNPLKESQQTFPDAIPGTPWGHYGKVSGKSSAHATGLVYSQEPAAQMVAQVAAPRPGSKVLDLAAAPGGKSTQLAAYLDNTGILVSNEISKKRAKILVENMERFGARNTVVTNESAQHLAQVFPGYFDLIVLDAPCSGEGMFRKDPDATAYWHVDYPAECAALQREILADALTMLAPGGRLVYSTCTWAPEENEDMVHWLLETYPNLSLEAIPHVNGMAPGLGLPETARMYPHRFQGEGQFVAAFLDHSPIENHATPKKRPKKKKGKAASKAITPEQVALWQAFAKGALIIDLPGRLEVFGDQLYLLPEGLPDLSKLRIARNGLHLGTFKKNRFEPSFALGLALKPSEVVRHLPLDEAAFTAYVAGQPISLSEDLPNGWYQVLVGGNGLGFAKVAQKTLKNYYPKGLRYT